MIAEVVVDVPSQAVDKVFDYQVPPPFRHTMAPGCRVHVPFAGRPVQGFVMKLKETSDVPGSKLKPLSEQLDLTPPLTPELLDLSYKLKASTVSLHVAVLKAMLPQAMRAKYDKRIYTAGHAGDLPEELLALLDEEGGIASWDAWKKETDEESLSLVTAALRRGDLLVDPVVTTRKAEKTQLVYRISDTAMAEEWAESRQKKAPKQAAVLRLLASGELLTAADMKHICTKAVLDTLTEQGLLIKEQTIVRRDPYAGRMIEKSYALPLLDEQRSAMEQITAACEQREHRTFLLRGVTGSGKTEVYMQAIEKVLAQGKEAVVLVPEISLTPQMVHRFKGRFGSRTAVLHSALSKGEKYDEWKRIRDGDVDIVVGARSAVFAPFTNVGIIIIDEEHEASYKQEESPRYHARDAAIERAASFSCPVVLGSATPSLESSARASKGLYHMLTMENRINDEKLPEVTLVDMRSELKNGNRSMFSDRLTEQIRARMEKNEQIVLLLNKRGYASFMMCRDCGFVPECPHCDISLTYHRAHQNLQCHYCGYKETAPTSCPECESAHIRFFGTGTQKVEEELKKVIEGIRIIRMDVDTTQRKGAHEKLLDAFGRGEADVLLGTQMIAKGLDFPNITLVGVLAADAMLHLPDFRASERTFQLLTQVAGRAGRHEKTGEVLVQTYTPDHYSILDMQQHDYLSFYEKEMRMRRMGGHPPFYFLVLLQVQHEDLQLVVEKAGQMASYLRRELHQDTVVYGPNACAVPRIKDRYRYQVMIKYKVEPHLERVLHDLRAAFQPDLQRTGLQLTIDTNPYMMM
ncbi:primosomal protein N' [Alkalicoccus chagannorensis]|uniref:primosomal protein N' n=1 Tax=Alkalicoccus chagannorensis TaxID=427072 RepID=UPI00040CFA5F|nr:primosomal protein N' [Alkalicoccus chagannorensis]